MASIHKVRKGTLGRRISLNTGVDLTPFSVGSTSAYMLVIQPNGSQVVWEATFRDSDPSLGILEHDLVTGDVDEVGDYKILTVVEDPDSNPPIRDYGTSMMVLTVQDFSHR